MRIGDGERGAKIGEEDFHYTSLNPSTFLLRIATHVVLKGGTGSSIKLSK